MDYCGHVSKYPCHGFAPHYDSEAGCLPEEEWPISLERRQEALNRLLSFVGQLSEGHFVHPKCEMDIKPPQNV